MSSYVFDNPNIHKQRDIKKETKKSNNKTNKEERREETKGKKKSVCDEE